ncbi:hypothetical protein [Dongia sedimenti]|uniref:HAMP domain-containing protein n=1 Tax=Dongia sedimenti TaxID=3064282 RepID=A0ABU0YVT3_9PROT|nr:hypothetical protein [Rhodospirillaceae bacterium R-7]
MSENNSGRIKGEPDLLNERRLNRLRIAFAVGVLIVGVFSALAVSRFDFIDILGLDVFFQGVGDVRFSADYVVIRLVINFLIAGVLGIGAVVYFSVTSHRSGHTAIAESAVDPGTPSPPKREPADIVIANLDERVASLQGRATQIYWTIIVILVAGVFLIIFSGYLSSLDSKLSAVWVRVGAERELATSELSKAVFQQSKDGQTTTDPAVIGRYQTANDNYGKVLEAVLAQASKANGESNTEILSGSTVLRIGIVGLLIFLTQILISLYRYNSRLIAFYIARRDALTLSKGDDQKFKKFAEILLPRQLDFGREPKHPLAEAAELLRQAGPSAFSRSKQDPKKGANGKSQANGDATEPG